MRINSLLMPLHLFHLCKMSKSELMKLVAIFILQNLLIKLDSGSAAFFINSKVLAF